MKELAPTRLKTLNCIQGGRQKNKNENYNASPESMPMQVKGPGIFGPHNSKFSNI